VALCAGQAVLDSERAMKRLRLDNKNTVKDIFSFLMTRAREAREKGGHDDSRYTTDTYGCTMRLAHHLTVVERVYTFLFDDHAIFIEEGMDRCQKTVFINYKKGKKKRRMMRFFFST